MITKFDYGQVMVTRGVHARMSDDQEFSLYIHCSLTRHFSGDWGDLCEEDRETNESALLEGYRLFSSYKQKGMPSIWIITEADRSVTTILFPDEY
jgi:hypothetical protein